MVEELELKLDNDQFVKKSKQSEKALKSVFEESSKAAKKADKAHDSVTSSLFRANLAAEAAAKAMGWLRNSIAAGIDNARQYEQSTQRLSATLSMYGQNTTEVTTALRKQASAMQDLTGISDDTIRDMQAQAMNMGISVDRTQKLIKASVALGKVMNTGPQEAMKQLAKSTTGLVEETMRLVPGVQELTKEQLQAGEAIDLVAEKYGNLAGRPMDSMISQMDLATEAVGDFFEAMIVGISEEGTMTKFFKNMADEVKNLTFVIQSEEASFWDWLTDPVRVEQKRRQAATVRGDELGGTKNLLAGAAGRIGGKIGDQLVAQEDMFGGMFAQFESAEFTGQFDQLLDARMAREEFMLNLAADNEAKLTEIKMTEMERRAHMEEVDTERMVEMTRARYDYLGEKELERTMQSETTLHALSQSVQGMTNQVFGGIADISASYLEAMITGQEFAWKQAADAFLKETGRQLVSSGIRHGLEAAALGIMSWGMTPQAYALLAVAGSEVAAGLGMMAGSLVLPDAVPKGGGGGRRVGGGGGSGGFTGGMGSRGGGGQGESKTINVTFNGPTTAVEVGIAIKQAIKESERAGF
jgi:hypothetical protein